MPQLDLFTIQSQVICLIISLFFIYNFLLKYALSSFDAYNRLKIKKLNFFRTQNVILSYFSIALKKKIFEYSNLIIEGILDISKVYKKKMIVSFKQWYKNKLISKILIKNLNIKFKRHAKKVRPFNSRINIMTIRYYIIQKLENKIKTIAYYTENAKYKKTIEKLKKRINFKNLNIMKNYILMGIDLNKDQVQKDNFIKIFNNILKKINKNK